MRRGPGPCNAKLRTRSGRLAVWPIAFEYERGRPALAQRMPGAWPGHMERAAGKRHFDIRVHSAFDSQRRHRRRRATTAGRRPARTALVHTEDDVAAIAQLDETRVNPARETAVVGEQRPDAAKIRGIDVIHQNDGMRVARGDQRRDECRATNLDRTAPTLIGEVAVRSCGTEGRFLQLQLDVATPMNQNLDAFARSLQQVRDSIVDQSRARQPSRNAAGSVATLFGLAAVAVPDGVSPMAAMAFHAMDRQELVESDAAMAIAHESDLHRVCHERPTPRVDDDEIIAKAMHLGEMQAHGLRGG